MWISVGISGLTIQMENVFKIAGAIKAASSKIIVVAGGAHPSSLPELTLEEGKGCIDIVVVGEGEYTLLDLTQNRPWEDIPGIVFNTFNQTHRNKPREPISDLNAMPFPARDLLKMEKYSGWGPLKNAPSTHLIASRGCPFDCIFCSEKAVFGRNHRRRDPEKVVDEIEYLIDAYGIKEVSFYDDLFTLKKDWVISVCDNILQRGLRIDWKALSRVDTVDRDMLHHMKDSGCWMLFFGFESGSQLILDAIQKKQTVEQNIRAAELTKESGLDIFGFFMLGNAGETEETVIQTIKLARKIKSKHSQFTIVRPDPGSDLYFSHIHEIEEKNISWSEYYAFPKDTAKIPVVGTTMTVEDLLYFRQLALQCMGRKALIKLLVRTVFTFNIGQLKRIIKIVF